MKIIKLLILLAISTLLLSCSGAAGGGGVGSTGDSITPVPVTFDVGGNNFFLIIQNPDSVKHNQLLISSSNSRAVEDYKLVMKNQGITVNIPYEHPPVKVDLKRLNNTISRNISTPSAIVNETTRWDENLTVGTHHDFYAENAVKGTTNNTSAANAELKAIGEHCYVWYKAKEGDGITDDSIFTNLKDKFDSIYNKETSIFGSNIRKVYNNIYFNNTPVEFVLNNIFIPRQAEKIHIIIYDLKDDCGGTGVTEYGYFWSLDFLRNDYLSSDPEDSVVGSNECQCIHIDSYMLANNTNAVYSTLGHEFQHLLHFVNKTLNNIDLINQELIYSETWFNEMMSMVCEDIMLTQLGLLVSAGPQNRLYLFNRTYDNGFDWLSGDDVLISYANAYAFGAFLLRNYGIDCIKEIATNEYINERAILEAVKLEDNSITTFDELLKQFYDVILYPDTPDKKNLNKAVLETINGVEYNCAEINLKDDFYRPYRTNTITESLANELYGAIAGQIYNGPIILNNRYYNQLGSKGSCIIYFENDYDSIILNTNPYMKYYIEIINN